MAAIDKRRSEMVEATKSCANGMSKVRRLYLDSPSYALGDKHGIEFEIKTQIANRYRIPFRSVVFSGSAQIGFSPQKDRIFIPGDSDLDVACIDAGLFTDVWLKILDVTHAFNDESCFLNPGHAEKLTTNLLKRGMILLDFIPKCDDRTEEIAFLDRLSSYYRTYFSRISLAIYANEQAFCWKQMSVLSDVLGV
jgi:hypothetical protein